MKLDRLDSPAIRAAIKLDPQFFTRQAVFVNLSYRAAKFRGLTHEPWWCRANETTIPYHLKAHKTTEADIWILTMPLEVAEDFGPGNMIYNKTKRSATFFYDDSPEYDRRPYE